MKAISRSLIVLVLAAIVIMANQAVVLSDKLKEANKEQEKLFSSLVHSENEKRELRESINKQQIYAAEQEKALSYFKDELGVTDLTNDQLLKAMEISKSTKLNIEASLPLVKYSDIYKVDYALVLSMIEIESNFNQYLVGTSQDRGYMQIIPNTEKFLAEAYGEELGLSYDPKRIFEPEYNLALGIKYIHEISSRHGTDLNKVLTEYNRGPYGLRWYYKNNNTYETLYSKTILDRRSKYLRLNLGSTH